MKKPLVLLLLLNILSYFTNAQSPLKVYFKVVDIADGTLVKIPLNFTFLEYSSKSYVAESKYDKVGNYLLINPKVNLSQNFAIYCSNCNSSGFELQTFLVSSLSRSKSSPILEINVKSTKYYIDILEDKIKSLGTSLNNCNAKYNKLYASNKKLNADNEANKKELKKLNETVTRLNKDIVNGNKSLKECDAQLVVLRPKVATLTTAIEKVSKASESLFEAYINLQDNLYYSSMKMMDCFCTNYNKKTKKISLEFNVSNIDYQNLDSTIIIGTREIISMDVLKSWKNENHYLNQSILRKEFILDGKKKKFEFFSGELSRKKSTYNITFKNIKNIEIGRLFLSTLDTCKEYNVREAIFKNLKIENPLVNILNAEQKTLKVRVKDAFNTRDGDYINLYLVDKKLKTSKFIIDNKLLGNEWYDVELESPESYLIVEQIKEGTQKGCSADLEIEGIGQYRLVARIGESVGSLKVLVDLKKWFLD